MSVKICIAETSKELDIIYNSEKFRNNLICLPLNLETYLYCLEKNIEFIDPINIVTNEFHKKSLVEGENFVNSIELGNKTSEALALEVISILRFRFYSVIFLLELFEKIKKKYKIYSLVILENKSKSHLPDSLLIDDIVSNLFSDVHIEKKSAIVDIKDENQNYSYEIKTKTQVNKKNILLNNLGYNFKRIIFSKMLNPKYSFYAFEESKISIFKKFLFKLLKVKIVNFKKINDNSEKNIIIKNINYKFSNPDVQRTIFLLINKLENYFSDFFKKKKAIDVFLKQNSFSLILTNFVKGVGGFITEGQNNTSYPTVCISHGTISEKFNNYDEIYKKNIASAVFGGSSNYFAIQSKIAEKALNTHKIKGKKILTGNILFSENCKNNSAKKPKQILFAVTLKQFTNLQFLGVEMYYEFIKNLNLLSRLSLEKKIKIIVKLHPSEAGCINTLKKHFKNLIFTNEKIDKLFKKCFVTLSYSSTVIEDSLYNRVPVILFDQWKRYIHCKSKSNSEKKALHYVNTYEDLSKTIDKIFLSDKFDFEEFIFQKPSRENINNNFFKLIR